VLELLEALKSKLFEEEPSILFNYLGMHQRSIELVRRFRNKEHDRLARHFTDPYLLDESYISNMVLLVLRLAKVSENNA
jgi:hypothetical protein